MPRGDPSGFIKAFFFKVKSNPAVSLSADTAWVTQDIIIDPEIKYAFAVKAVNVQGSSDFSLEKIKELKGSNPFLANIITAPALLSQLNISDSDNPPSVHTDH